MEEIDGQHKTLVSLINQLHTAIRERHGSKASREILDQLADYTRTHFLLEESLMRVSKYPGYAAHHAQHEDLIKQVTALQEKLADHGGVTGRGGRFGAPDSAGRGVTPPLGWCKIRCLSISACAPGAWCVIDALSVDTPGLDAVRIEESGR